MSARVEFGTVLLAYAAMSVCYTWPLAWLGADHVFYRSPLLLADAYYLLWVLSWSAHVLFTDPTRVFQGNVAYPAPHVVTGTETLLGVQPLFAPLWAGTGNPVLGLNVVVLASFILMALSMHYLVRRWTGSTLAAVTAAVAFTFAPWRDLGRVYLLQMQYVPVLLLFVDRAIDRGAWRSGVAAGLVLGLQILTSIWVGFMAVLVIAVYGGVHWMASLGRWSSATWRSAVCVPLAALPLILPIVIAYAAAAAHGSLATDPDALVSLMKAQPFGVSYWVVAIYAGWGTCVAGVLGIVALTRAPQRLDRIRLVALCVCALAGLGLAEGPAGVLGTSVAPYRWLAAVVPGFDRLRAPVRFGAVTGFALSVLAGYGVAALAALRGPGTARLVAGRVGALLVFAWVALPLVRHPPVVPGAVPTGSRVPPVYRWLAAHGDGGTLLELPIGARLGLSQTAAAARAMYMSTYHWLPLVNAYTGFPLPSHALTERWAQQLPSPEALRVLSGCTGLRWILVHGSDPRLASLDHVPGVRLRERFPRDASGGEDLLYEVTAADDAACRDRLRAPSVPIDDVSGRPPRGVLAVDGLSPTVVHGLDSRVVIEVENREEQRWEAVPVAPAARVWIMTRWIELQSGAEYDREDIPLPIDLAGGVPARFEAWLRHPKRPGDYRLDVALVRGDRAGAAVQRRVHVR
jgi:hypothetical protein